MDSRAGGSSSEVERLLAKEKVAGSSPVSRSMCSGIRGANPEIDGRVGVSLPRACQDRCRARRRSQEARQGSAKPPLSGSNPDAASNSAAGLGIGRRPDPVLVSKSRSQTRIHPVAVDLELAADTSDAGRAGYGARGGSRTHTLLPQHNLLRVARLPVTPPGLSLRPDSTPVVGL